MIPNYYDYFVSSSGHIYNTKTGAEEPIWIDSKAGYSHISLKIEGKRRIRKVHRLVALIYIPNPDDNLEWSNSYLNNKHARETGLNNISETNKIRWKDESFAKKAKENMSKAAINRNMNGQNNPNFKIKLLYRNKEYTIRELQEIINLTYSGLYTKIKKILDKNLKSFIFNEDTVYILKG